MSRLPNNELLIPLPSSTIQPGNTSASADQSNSLLDLISSSSLGPTSTPLFPERRIPPPSIVRIQPRPKTPPSLRPPDETPTSPGFGEFISVPASADPLAVQGEAGTPFQELSFESHFVQGAKARIAEKERQMMDEFRQSESDTDPLGLLSERGTDPLILDVEPSPQDSSQQDALVISSELKRAESAPTPLSVLSESTSTPPPEPEPSAASASASPLLGFSGRLSLPRWTSLLSSSLQSLPPTSSVLRSDHTPPPHPPEHSTHGKPVRDSSITHDNPFTHVFSPPSGAPGYTGEKWDKGFGDDLASKSSSTRLKLMGRSEMTTPILLVETAEKLRPFLPALRRLAPKWNLLYSLDQHGISLATFYARCEQPVTGGCLIAIRDSEGATFGVWCGDGVRKHEGYTGSGESFLWTQRHGDSPVQVFKWTGKNDYVRLCESDFISFGGGNGKFGLYLDSAFLDGESAPCPTFDNEPLCSLRAGTSATGTIKFECVGIEAWSII